MVRALASHQCGPGSIPGVDIIMWVEVLVGSHSLVRVFFSGFYGFSPSTKTNISKFKFDLEAVGKEPLCGGATAFPFICLVTNKGL